MDLPRAKIGHEGMFTHSDAVDKILYIDSKIGNDFTSFLSTATGFGNVGLKNGKPFLEVKFGDIDVGKVVVSGKEMEL